MRDLAAHPAVAQVHYPRAPSGAPAPDGGAVVSFTTGSEERSRRIVEALRLFSVCVSFGSVHSTVCLPCATSHASLGADARRARGLTPDLVRLSVGIEDRADVLADLRQALAAASSASVGVGPQERSAAR